MPYVPNICTVEKVENIKYTLPKVKYLGPLLMEVMIEIVTIMYLYPFMDMMVILCL